MNRSCSLYLVLLIALSGAAAWASPNTLQIRVNDVGQGDGIVVTYPDSTTMSIDCASGSIKAYSHFHSDHCAPFDGGDFNRNNVIPGQVIYNKDGVTVTCVAANGNVIGQGSAGYKAFDDNRENEWSMALWFKYKGFDFLAGGDLTDPAEYNLGAKLAGLDAKIDIYKVHHHGSASSSGQSFLNSIRPEYAVISVGNGNSYGHPTQEALDRLDKAGVRTIYQTEKGAGGTASNVAVGNGDILFSTDGASYTISSPSFSQGPFPVDEYATPTWPHLIVSEAAIAGAYLSPEDHRWIELYLPPGASSVDLGNLYWLSKGPGGQLAKNGSLTMMSGDVAIVHKTDKSDPRADENNATGKGTNGWWDVYTHIDENHWVTTEDCFMISRDNSWPPDPSNILDSVTWSNHDGKTPKNALDALNYLITNGHWGNPIPRSGLFSESDDTSGVGGIGSGYAQRKTTEDTDSMQDWVISTISSEGTPPPTPTPEATSPPQKQIEVVLNRNILSADEILTVDVVVQPITGRPFDAYAAIMDAGGRVLFWIQPGNSLNSGTTPIPLATKVGSLPNRYSGTLLNVRIPPGHGGDYQIGVGLVDSGRRVKGASSAFEYDVAGLSVR
ncbi:MAG: hypothetical protein NTZ78_12395 [Candidatus Aureabacteria bacterium]|nr:hypothetical protein [Candidatus Auribacterota bacterium]